MFDPSFFELIVICVVALLVLGPDRLPGAIKTCGLWIGRLRRSFNNIKREIEQEVGADEIRRQLRNEDILAKFKNTKTQINETIDSVKKEAETVKDNLNLTKEFSEITEDNQQETDNSIPETLIDPIDKLATNDPVVKKTPSVSESQRASSPSTESSNDISSESKNIEESPASQEKDKPKK